MRRSPRRRSSTPSTPARRRARVTALPATTPTPSFTVSWSGTDGAGPGIADYDVYVSDDGGPFTVWQSDTTATSATYTGQAGHTYAFYSVATDNLGLVQPTPIVAQATVEILAPMAVTSIDSVSPDPRNTSVSTLDVTFSLPIDTSSLSPRLVLTDNGQPVSTTGVSLSPGLGHHLPIDGLSGLTTAEGTYTLTVNAADIPDQYGNPGTGTVSTSWLMDTTPPTSTVNALPARPPRPASPSRSPAMTRPGERQHALGRHIDRPLRVDRRR